MKTAISDQVSHNGHILRIVAGTGAILLIPLVAMLVSDEVQWSLWDFVIMGALLLGAGLVYEFVSRKLNRASRRVITAVIVAIVVAVVWIQLAVGIYD
ncbi:MAG: hypothetical protein U0524_01815 [Candidatus Saccharimonadales bacterium]